MTYIIPSNHNNLAKTYITTRLIFFGAAPTDCTQDLTPGQQLSIGSVLLGSSWLHDGPLNRPPADGTWYQPRRGRPSED